MEQGVLRVRRLWQQVCEMFDENDGRSQSRLHFRSNDLGSVLPSDEQRVESSIAQGSQRHPVNVVTQ